MKKVLPVDRDLFAADLKAADLRAELTGQRVVIESGPVIGQVAGLKVTGGRVELDLVIVDAVTAEQQQPSDAGR